MANLALILLPTTIMLVWYAKNFQHERPDYMAAVFFRKDSSAFFEVLTYWYIWNLWKNIFRLVLPSSWYHNRKLEKKLMTSEICPFQCCTWVLSKKNFFSKGLKCKTWLFLSQKPFFIATWKVTRVIIKPHLGHIVHFRSFGWRLHLCGWFDS